MQSVKNLEVIGPRVTFQDLGEENVEGRHTYRCSFLEKANVCYICFVFEKSSCGRYVCGTWY
jgi:hypothetical protein